MQVHDARAPPGGTAVGVDDGEEAGTAQREEGEVLRVAGA